MSHSQSGQQVGLRSRSCGSRPRSGLAVQTTLSQHGRHIQTCHEKDEKQNSKSDVQMKKGKEMLSRDLDIVNLLEMIKNYKLMKDVFFTQDDRFLLRLLHRDMIDSSQSSDDDKTPNQARNSTVSVQQTDTGKRKSLSTTLFQ